MKKVIAILFLLSSFVFANSYNKYCAANSPSKTISGNIMSLSGFNSLSRNLIENVLEKEIKKETNSKFDIKIKNFYGTNILEGEFKSLQANAKKYEHKGIYLTDINVKTICPYNHIFYEDNNLYFKENMVLKFSAKLTQSDIEKTLNYGKIDPRIAALLKGENNYGFIISIIKKLDSINIPIKIDKNNIAKLRLDKINNSNGIISFDSFILIDKNK